MALEETNITKEELEKMSKKELEEFILSINEFTKWKCLEAQAYFNLRLAQVNIPKIKFCRR